MYLRQRRSKLLSLGKCSRILGAATVDDFVDPDVSDRIPVKPDLSKSASTGSRPDSSVVADLRSMTDLLELTLRPLVQ